MILTQVSKFILHTTSFLILQRFAIFHMTLVCKFRSFGKKSRGELLD